MSRARYRDRRPGRREENNLRDAKQRVLVVCEGSRSEPEYIDGFVRAAKNSRVKVELVGGAGVPISVVRCAINKRDENEQHAKQHNDSNLIYEQVWCLIDVDDHPNMQEAKAAAKQAGIRLAISNPSFELWLLIHFEKNPPGMQRREVFLRELKAHLPGYNKGVNFQRDFASRITQADSIAQRLDQLANDVSELGRNPTTGVYKLTRSISAL